jgi:hypothetical protein
LAVKTVISPTSPPLKLISTVTVTGYSVTVPVGNRLEREIRLEGESFVVALLPLGPISPSLSKFTTLSCFSNYITTYHQKKIPDLVADDV